jgi:hypothetical protein
MHPFKKKKTSTTPGLAHHLAQCLVINQHSCAIVGMENHQQNHGFPVKLCANPWNHANIDMTIM